MTEGMLPRERAEFDEVLNVPATERGRRKRLSTVHLVGGDVRKGKKPA